MRSLSFFRLFVLALVMTVCLGCGDDDDDTNTNTNTDESVARGDEHDDEDEAATIEVEPHYAVHEWGLIDFALGESTLEVAAGPGDPALAAQVDTAPPVNDTSPTPMRPLPPTPDPPERMRPRKPVLYVHLLENTQELSLSAKVRLTDGRVLEHWPPANVDGGEVVWPEVTAKAGNCRGSGYPERADARCAAAPDGYCEAAELREYETSDGACLSVDGNDYDHLFYRGDANAPALPLQVVRDGDGVLATWRPETAAVGAAWRVTRAGAAVLIRRVDIGASGEEFLIEEAESGDGLEQAMDEVSRTLRELGLSDPEARAFEHAWMDELFGGDPRVRDALLYFLPADQIASIATLELSPAPDEVRRVMMVRIDLGS